MGIEKLKGDQYIVQLTIGLKLASPIEEGQCEEGQMIIYLHYFTKFNSFAIVKFKYLHEIELRCTTCTLFARFICTLST